MIKTGNSTWPFPFLLHHVSPLLFPFLFQLEAANFCRKYRMDQNRHGEWFPNLLPPANLGATLGIGRQREEMKGWRGGMSGGEAGGGWILACGGPDAR